MPDDFPDVRRALDALPVPPLPPVDMAAIYADAMAAHARSARRWKRVAVAVAALAAGVLLFALGVFVGREAVPPVAVRQPDPSWGSARPPEPDPRVAELLAEQQALVAAIRDANAKHADLQDLIVTVARDVSDRDGERKQQLAELADKFRAFEAVTARQFQDAERTNTALYNVVFPPKPKGDAP